MVSVRLTATEREVLLEMVARGHYPSVSAAIRDAVQWLIEQAQLKEEVRQQLRLERVGRQPRKRKRNLPCGRAYPAGLEGAELREEE